MGRFNKRNFRNYQQEDFTPETEYQLAYKRVKRIKGFYVHAIVYTVVNVFIISSNYFEDKSDYNFWSWATWNMAIFWGIGLAIHGFSVFGKNIFFGNNWEERKIQELMNKDKTTQWE